MWRTTLSFMLVLLWVAASATAAQAVQNLSAQQLRMLQDQVVVKPEAEEKTAGGIIIPDTAKEKAAQGTVVVVGPGKTSDDGTPLPPAVQVGDAVLFGKYSGTEIKLDGEEHLIMRESDIFAVIE